MTNKDKFLSLVSGEETKTLKGVSDRIKNRAMLRESQQIALKVLTKLDELGWSQKDLAEKMEVSPQQISKIVSGKENLTIDTQIKLQNVLDIPILASFYEHKINSIHQQIIMQQKQVEIIIAQTSEIMADYVSSKVIKFSPKSTSIEYYLSAQ
jgi:transcriptional regulator with XRE-family HTH domain